MATTWAHRSVSPQSDVYDLTANALSSILSRWPPYPNRVMNISIAIVPCPYEELNGSFAWNPHQVPMTSRRTTTTIGTLRPKSHVPWFPEKELQCGQTPYQFPTDQLRMRKYICWARWKVEGDPARPTGDRENLPARIVTTRSWALHPTHCTYRLTNDPNDAPVAFRTGVLDRCS